MSKKTVLLALLLTTLLIACTKSHNNIIFNKSSSKKYNVLFIISDDLCATALSCYGNKVCQTPNIDRIASEGTLFSRAYCQFPVCASSRASFMSGYYPHGSNIFSYVNGRKAIGGRHSWSQHFMQAGYHCARVSKIYHMPVPRGIEQGTDGTDNPHSWNEKYNSQGPEWQAKGDGETLEGNPDGKKPVMGGNTFVVVEADGDDMVHSDGKTAHKACELLRKYKASNKNFWLGVGFVRPHVPFVSPRKYYKPYTYANMILPKKLEGDWDDIPKAGINYKTSKNMQMDIRRQKKAIGGYYASVSYMDAQVGKLMTTLKEEGLEDNTIVIFTSDHGYHLGEHDFWAKVSLHEESTKVPFIIKVPGKKPAVCDSFSELVDLYPTTSELCGLTIPKRIQGKSLAKCLDDPHHSVRDMAFCVNKQGFMLRTDRWAYIQYGEDAKNGIELFDMHKDPKQYHNLAKDSGHKEIVEDFKKKLAAKLIEIRNNNTTRGNK